MVVVGAGLAGLTAAYELERKGFTVSVVEARDRVGGRVLTVRFPGGRHAEAGGEFIDTGHTNLRGYLKRFDLALEDIRDAPHLDGMAYLGGRRQLYDDLYTKGVKKQLDRWYAAVERLAEDIDPAQPTRNGAALDGRSVQDLMDEVELSGVARELVGHEEIRDDYTAEADELSLLFHVYFTKLLENQSESGTEAFRVSGGNDRLPRALSRALGNAVELEAPVTEISQTDSGVTVVADGRSVTADFCVLAAPLPALRNIGFDPAPPKRLAQAIAKVQYGRGTKTLLEYKRRFWRERGLSGDTLTDLTLGTAWEGTDRQPGTSGVLVGYTVGSGGAAFGKLSRRKRIDTAVAQIEKIYPDSERHLDRAVTIDWAAEPYTGGTYTAFAPGQFTRYWNALRRPHGRVYLAGEHTDGYTGYMEGAIRSGKRVAAEIASRG